MDPPENPYPDSSSLPPFSFHEDPAFIGDMTVVAPDRDIREDICNDLQWTLTRVLIDGEVPPGLTSLGDDTKAQLIITQKTGVAPALRVVFSVEDNYPKRHVYFHAAALRDQNGDE